MESKIDFANLSFDLNPVPVMYVATCENGVWQKGELLPYENISISPAAAVLHYGQGLFEGLKAYATSNGKSNLFRPKRNAERMRLGCERLMIPPITQEIFMDGVLSVVKESKEFIPPYESEKNSQGALYIRPAIWGTGGVLGVKPSSEYKFLVFANPVGPYFKKGFQPIKLKIEKSRHRAVIGGSGNVKAIGNYAPGMYPAANAKVEGYSEILYLDAETNSCLEEVGAANFFCVKNGVLCTPSLDEGTILPGITRDSILMIAQNLGIKTQEEKVQIKDLPLFQEAFATGTAAVVAPISSVHYQKQDHEFNNGHVGDITKTLYKKLLSIQHGLEPDPYGWIHVVE